MSKELELKRDIISNLKSAISFYQDLSDEEKDIIDTFTESVQEVINLLRPRGGDSNIPREDKKFDFVYSTFMLAEGAISRAEQKTMEQIEAWKSVLFYVLGLSYEDIELVYLILLRYAEQFDKGYKEHKRATLNRTDAILFLFKNIVQESRHAFMELKRNVEEEFAVELEDFKKNKKDKRRDKV